MKTVRRYIIAVSLPLLLGVLLPACHPENHHGTATEPITESPPRQLAGEPTEAEGKLTILDWESTSANGAPQYDFGVRVIGSSVKHVFHVKNIGAKVVMLGEGFIGLGFEFPGRAYPGGGNCKRRLEPQDSCTVGVQFRPNLTGAMETQLKITYDEKRSVVRDLIGRGIEPGSVQVAPLDGKLEFPAALVKGAPTEKVFVVTNEGGGKVTALSPQPFKNAFFKLKEGGYHQRCPEVLPSMGKCRLIVVFTPPAPTVYTDVLSLTYQEREGSQTAYANFGARGIPPASLRFIDDDPFDFGMVGVGMMAEVVFRVFNDGGVEASGITLSLEGGTYFKLRSGDYDRRCHDTLRPGDYCELRVTYAPGGGEPVADKVVVKYHNKLEPAQSALRLTGSSL